MTTCIGCSQNDPTRGFYIDSRTGGVRQPCKECLRAKASIYAKSDIGRAKKAAYREAHREEFKVYNRDYRSRNPGMDTEKTRAWSAANPQKRTAHRLVWRAILRGQMQQKPCETCGEPKAHAHHDDYSKPLEVRWLCPIHHAEYHSAIRNRSDT